MVRSGGLLLFTALAAGCTNASPSDQVTSDTRLAMGNVRTANEMARQALILRDITCGSAQLNQGYEAGMAAGQFYTDAVRIHADVTRPAKDREDRGDEADRIGPPAAYAQLHVAESYLKTGCPDKAKELFADIESRFIGPDFEAVRRAAEDGIGKSVAH